MLNNSKRENEKDLTTNVNNSTISNIPPYKCKLCGLGDIEFPHDICNFCGWEDDSVQNDDPDYMGGANYMSLNQYRNFWAQNKEEILKTLKDNPFVAIEMSQEYYKKHFQTK